MHEWDAVKSYLSFIKTFIIIKKSLQINRLVQYKLFLKYHIIFFLIHKIIFHSMINLLKKIFILISFFQNNDKFV